MSRTSRTKGTLILDSEGLSKIVRDDHRFLARVAEARKANMLTVVSAATLVEARDPKVSQERFDWAVSRLTIKPVTEDVARSASQLLAEHGMHGHQHAIDAMVAATALGVPGRRIMLTSDPKDMNKLCGKSIRVVGI
jgi:predicted nucleic acid-binding protein